MKQAEEIGFAVFIFIMFIIFVLFGLKFTSIARTVPMTLAVPGLVCAGILAGKKILQGIGAAKALKETPGPGTPAPAKPEGRRILEIWSWVLGFIAGIHLLGFLIAIPLFLLSFLFFFAKRSFVNSSIISIVFTVGIYLLFYVGLQTEF
ncbi:MAG: tripartite tricarboxylate transporter TctB family protein [Desulfobacterales bacterium]|nr:tripartite tricarboxylate transporter TctB family protein [Desulfobacterales bacterium]